MAIKRYQLSDTTAKLFAALQDAPFFADYTITYENSVLLISDGDLPLFRWTYDDSRYKLRIYKDDTNYISLSLVADGETTYLWACDNGAILEYKYGTKYGVIRFVKSTKGTLIVIVTSTTGTGDASKWYAESLYCATQGDNLENGTFTISSRVSDQFEVVPMMTDCNVGDITYTANSGFLMYSDQVTTIKPIVINDTVWLSDGYFAIKDVEVDSDG